jgi:endothelin-converting enzyme/putative endopeptidase
MKARLFAAVCLVAFPLATVLTIAQTTADLKVRTTTAASEAAASEVVQAFRPADSASGLQLDALDKSADACTDFYQFACGGWIAKNPVPPDRSGYGRFDELQERNNDTLHTILETAAAGRDPEFKKIGDYYASCLDETAIDAKGAGPLDPLLKKIAALSSARDLAPLVAELHTVGVNVFFQFGSQADFKDASVEMALADQGGLGLPDRDYYVKDDAKSVELRAQYVDHIAKMSALLGAAADQAKASAQQAMAIETALAKSALDAVSRRDPNKVYHKMSNAELQALTPPFMWNRYFSGIGSPPIYALNVAEPEFFKALGQLVAATPLDQIKAYLRWQVVHASAAVLAKPFVDENFRFFGTALTGAKELRPRWKRCVQYTDNDLGESLGQAFVKIAFGPQAKADTLKMVHELEAALQTDIEGLGWMTPATKKEALVKLRAIADKIGYPDHWRDWRADHRPRRRARQLAAQQRIQFHRQMARSASRWTRPLADDAADVNAYTTAREQHRFPPASCSRRSTARSGCGGQLRRHRRGHRTRRPGFDQGRQFDARGNLKTGGPRPTRNHSRIARSASSTCAGFTAVDEVKLNGN